MKFEKTALKALQSLRAEKKFQEDEEDMYPGAPDEETRLRCEGAINQMIDALIQGLPKQSTTAFVLSEFEKHLNLLSDEDTEEREMACVYCERIMNILDIESSEGLLNTWLYGFDPMQKPG